MVLFDDDEDNIMNQFFEDDDESDDDALILSLIALDEEEQRRKKRRRGSVHGHEVVYRDRHAGNLRIVADYFADVPVYNNNFLGEDFGCQEIFFRELLKVLKLMMTILDKGQML
jgi:hypothetical protein